MSFQHSLETIQAFYANKNAERSGVPYINHINEGLAVMFHIGASNDAKGGYCLHPLVQSQKDFNDRLKDHWLDLVDAKQLLLAVEYRNLANSFLSPKTPNIKKEEIITLSAKLNLMPDVKDMLIADKVQNYKDFLKYHKDTHKNSDTLNTYFNIWLNDILDVDYYELVRFAEEA